MLDKIDAKYSIVFASNKYIGTSLRIETPSLHQVEEVFFKVDVSEKETHYILPNNTYCKYKIDELPYYLTSKTVIAVDFSNYKSQKQLKQYEYFLDGLSSEVNNLSTDISLNINSTSKKAIAKIKEQHSGDFALLKRNELSAIRKNFGIYNYYTELFKQLGTDYKLTDSVKINELEIFPYTITIEYTFESSELIQVSNAKTLKIELNNLISNHLWESDMRDRLTVYIVPFKYSSICSLNLTFDKDVSLVEKHNLNTFQNDVTGLYQMTTSEINKKNFSINSKRVINNDYIHPLNYADFHITNSTSLLSIDREILFEDLESIKNKKPTVKKSVSSK